ncbi:MAG: tRNA-guanine transglycosylase, partial [Oscillibacter sp.]|nr:tRNA-guanine transglycosylase [Oscillibacter sp.]
MGVGTPVNILEAVRRGVDFFDCVMPSRNGRHGKLFTWDGTINILNEKYASDERPVSERCTCPLCRHYSRAYLRHLFKAEEVLALRLAVLHNLQFYNDLMRGIRDAIEAGTYQQFYNEYAERLARRI